MPGHYSDEVSYVLMVQTAGKTGGSLDTRSMKRAILDAWQDCLVPVGESHGYLDVLISKGRLLVLSHDYSISKIALECARDYRLLPMDALHTACCKAFGLKEICFGINFTPL